MRDELQHQAVVILEEKHLGAVPTLRRAAVAHAVLEETFDPEPECAGKYRERRDRELASALSAAKRAGPREEGHDGSR